MCKCSENKVARRGSGEGQLNRFEITCYVYRWNHRIAPHHPGRYVAPPGQRRGRECRRRRDPDARIARARRRVRKLRRRGAVRRTRRENGGPGLFADSDAGVGRQ